MTGVFDPNAYSHLSTDSAMIQAAVDDARKVGGTVVIPRINQRTGREIWDITEAICLYSGSTVILRNAHLRLADEVICNVFKNSICDTGDVGKAQCRQSWITIRGEGHALLDGGRYHSICERTPASFGHPPMYLSHLIRFQNAEHLIVENLHFHNHRYWAVCLKSCSHAHFSRLFFSSTGNVPNQDGIDLRLGCHHVTIENILGSTGDDLIALTAIAGGRDHENLPVGQEPSIHDVIIRNVLGYGVCGCSLIRLLNNDGALLYNITIDGVHETSPWSEQDGQLAINPDLYGVIDDTGHFVAPRFEVGAEGYRMDTLIRIGENFWYKNRHALPGETYGISIRNLTCHSCSAVTINCTLEDSVIENIRMFGNGFRAVLCNDGQVENVTFRDIIYARNCRPHPEDEHIHIEWNQTDADGFSAVYFNRTVGRGLYFDNLLAGAGLTAVFDGTGEVELEAHRIRTRSAATKLCASPAIRVLER